MERKGNSKESIERGHKKYNAKSKQQTEDDRAILEGALIEIKENYSQKLISEYKTNLQEYLEKKKEMIANIVMQSSKEELNLPIVMRALGKDFATIVGEPIYSAQELALVFDYYQDVMADINSVTKLPPTRQNFCAFSGITSVTYDHYLRDGDSDKRLVTQRIEDYINENNWTLASKGTLNAYAVEKRSRLKGIGGGYTEAKEDVNINLNTQTQSPQEMFKKIAGLLGGDNEND